MSQRKIYLALVHHPIRNKRDELVTTSVTNLDIHDISRSCRTFGIQKYYIVTPLEAQHKLVNRILGHWEGDVASAYNPDRQDALGIAQLVNSIDDAVTEIEKSEGEKPLIVATGANFKESDGDSEHLLAHIKKQNKPCLVLFGTGWGLHQTVLDRTDYFLGPIFGYAPDGYNHLSVRSAVAIYLSQLNPND